MRTLNRLAWLVAILISSGEIARHWGSGRFVPMAFDELAIAAALVWAASRPAGGGAGRHVAAWAAFCGFTLVLLVDTADHQINGPAKAAGPVYLVALGLMLAVGLWAVRRALRLLRGGDGR
jgi:hypothetical protein